MATDEPNWVNKLKWLSDSPLGEWYGVETDSSGSVVQVNLANNQLSGPIPPELGNLANLSRMELFGNQLSGPIPPELGNMREMAELYLYGNALSGPLPESLGDLTELAYLHLHQQQPDRTRACRVRPGCRDWRSWFFRTTRRWQDLFRPK